MGYNLRNHMFRIITSIVIACLLLVAVYLFYPVFSTTDQPLLIINMWDHSELPRNFRKTNDVLPKEKNANPSTLGLKELQASGSAQFSEKSLDYLLSIIPSKYVTLVDLRQESHGFINGIAVSWFTEKDWVNKGKSYQEVIDTENSLINQIANRYLIIAYASKKFPVPLWVSSAKTEAELASSKRLGYKRIPVTDHLKPTDEDVDAFINFVNALPRDILWLHFHCAAGEGRTTTFMVMYDMMRNATKVKLQDILLRQHLLGGINFLNEPSEDWKKTYNEERKAFLRQFYVYCQQNPSFQKTWSNWIAEQRKEAGSNKARLPQ